MTGQVDWFPLPDFWRLLPSPLPCPVLQLATPLFYVCFTGFEPFHCDMPPCRFLPFLVNEVIEALRLVSL